ncbi:MAG: SpoIIE family protein phosphatase, partial [Pseudomonadota bacterium]
VAADPRSHPAGDLAAVEGGLVFAQPLAHAPWTALVALDAARMERAALLEVSARLGGLIALIALTLALAASLIRREFIRPAEALVADIVAAGEGRDDGDVDRAPAGWRPYFRRIRRLFRENTEAAALRRELAIAARMQASVLPKRFPGADAPVAAWGLARPAREVGGDFFDLFDLPDGRLGFVVADVSGKGVPAALFMVLAHTLTRAAAAEAPSPASCLARVNRLLADENAETMFVTMALGVLDPASGRVVYANAGHNPPYLLGVGAPPRALDMPPGAALGVFEDAAFEDAEARLAPGETLLLFTDGVTEAMDRSGEEYGEDRLAARLASVGDVGPERLIEAVAADVDAFADGAPQADDLTLLALRRAASPPPLAATLGPDLAEIAVFAERLERWSEEAGLEPEDVHAVALALDELMTNAVEHGEAGEGFEMRATVRLEDGALVATLADPGPPFDPFDRPPPDLSARAEERPIGGLGLHFAREMTDAQRYERRDGLNVATLVKRLKGAP